MFALETHSSDGVEVGIKGIEVGVVPMQSYISKSISALI
jgi:hypothetical protein